MREFALRATAADVIDAGEGGAADLRQSVIIEGGGFARYGARCLGKIAHAMRLNSSTRGQRGSDKGRGRSRSA